MMNLEEKQIDSTPIFQGNFVSIAQDTVLLPNGHQSKRVVIRHPGAACILAITEEQQVVFVKQWRYATQQALLELPAGKLDWGEDPTSCALRELAEETPYCAERVELMSVFYTAPGFCDEKMYLYRAYGVTKNSTLKPDQDEFVETVLLSKDEIKQALKNQHIQDAKTLIGIQQWLLSQD